MSDVQSSPSKAFQVFLESAPKHASAWMTAVQALGAATALDKTSRLPTSQYSQRFAWTSACRFTRSWRNMPEPLGTR